MKTNTIPMKIMVLFFILAYPLLSDSLVYSEDKVILCETKGDMEACRVSADAYHALYRKQVKEKAIQKDMLSSYATTRRLYIKLCTYLVDDSCGKLISLKREHEENYTDFSDPF